MINIPKGTKDVLPEDSYKWHYVESVIRKITDEFGFKEIRTPVFEHTELFLRGVGDTTDIVNKEMYTFIDKGDRSMTLKPEGTAGVGRCYIENALDQSPQPTKMYYLIPVFRYEKPQNGRLREHHQFGIELYGSASPLADAEVITLVYTFLKRLGIEELKLNLNSIGCPSCRPKYNESLKEFLHNNKNSLCPQCLERMEKNPLRVLDCKESKCSEITKNAPKSLDYLCDECRKHHEDLKEMLSVEGIEYIENTKLVRGLDYYTKTVFEFISTSIGSQGTVCGGGRYDNLVDELGGKHTPAVGFGMGLERLIMVLEANNIFVGEKEIPLLYIAPLGENEAKFAFKICNTLRKNGISVETDLLSRSLKSQMKFANKKGYKYTIAIGSNEIESDKANLKNMADGTTTEIQLSKLTEILKEVH